MRTPRLFTARLLFAAILTAAASSLASAAEPPLPDRKPSVPAKDEAAKSDSEKPDKAKTEAENTGPTLPDERPSLAWTKPEIDAAKKECAALLEKLAIDYEPLDPIREGDCGAPAPIRVKSIGSDPAVEITPPATLRCPVAVALDDWLTKVVQPEARSLFHSPVVKVQNAADYDCRNRYGKAGGKLSEHALANALDISIFTLESKMSVALGPSWPKSGTLVARAPKTVPPLPERNPALLAAAEAAERKMDAAMGLKGPKFETVAMRAVPKGEGNATVSQARVTGQQILEVMKARIEPKAMAATRPDEDVDKPLEPPLKVEKIEPDAAARFMVEVHAGACDFFGTVLGPNANAAHKSHFHLDMIERRTAYCQ
ncbi:hypothetical protein A7A08_00413 [Methyloligella halotolerans]|uniref:Extensin-like C-terminal domain-containing protein n=1 Tax=Methyloligella halotolerans TaxID=1177755 RepID=A0A1E2S261_9HYPH|nr:extensin family protein [Methyloligella halotolerans]ODA68583.1 hypothetical protein A7A08_00413 [Methyloligella halotolerans]